MCPVLIGRPGEYDPDITPKFPFLSIWMDVQFYIYDLLNAMISDEYGWPIRITGKLESPVVMEHKVIDDQQ